MKYGVAVTIVQTGYIKVEAIVQQKLLYSRSNDESRRSRVRGSSIVSRIRSKRMQDRRIYQGKERDCGVLYHKASLGTKAHSGRTRLDNAIEKFDNLFGHVE